jgi:hypothetical protein
MSIELQRYFMRFLDSIKLKEISKYYVSKYIDSALCSQIRTVVSNSKNLSAHNKNLKHKKVVFFTVQGRPNMLAVKEGILAHGINLRNGFSEMVICDRFLPACDLPFVTSNGKLLCKACSSAAQKIYKSFDLPFHLFSDFINAEQIAEAERMAEKLNFEEYFNFEYLGMKIGKHVYAAVLRYLLRGTVENDDRTKEICRRYVKSAIMMADISKAIIERLKPDCVVMHHGIYLTTGIFSEYARSRGVRVVIFTPAYRKNTFLFSHDETYHKTLQDEPAENWESITFSDNDSRILDDYLNSRRWGSQDFISYYPNPLEDRDRIVHELALDPSKKIIGLFTNLPWDGQVVFHDNAFNNMFEWIAETIEYYIKKPQQQLIIRIHPAEVKGAVETQQKLDPMIRNKFPRLPANIKIIPSNSNVSTYTLSDLVDAAIVYTTKVGLEFSVKGIPVIIAGEAFYRNKGFTYDANSKSEYFSLLDEVSEFKQNSPELIARARKYAYYYFFRRFIPFGFTNHRTWNNVLGLKIDTLEQLLPGKDKYLDLICSGILEGTPFVIERTDSWHC